jgi:hypothetical protein
MYSAVSLSHRMNHIMSRPFRVAAISTAALLCAAIANAQQLQPAAPPPEIITLGRSVVPLCGPWKFTIGDSPIDPTTKQPLWANPAFDDSRWEAVDLTPKNATANAATGVLGYVPGWAARGHAGVSGYGWYRIRVNIHPPPGADLALAGPTAFDDAYEVFLDGTLLGGFGFSPRGPAVYYAQPVILPLTHARSTDQHEGTQVIAFRFWMSQTTLLQDPGGGGFNTAPLLGTADAMSAANQLGWVQQVKGMLAWPLNGVVFALLTVMALTLFLYNRSDYAYLWMALPCLLSALADCEFSAATTTQAVPAPFDLWFGNVFALPLSRFAGIMLLRAWFGLERPRWLPWAAAVAAVLDAVGFVGAIHLLPFIPLSLAPVFFVIQQTAYVTLGVLTTWLVFRGVRQSGAQAWLFVPLMLFVWVDWLATRLPFLHLSTGFFVFGVSLPSLTIEGFLVAAAYASLLVWRWIDSVHEQRRMSLDLKQAQEVQQVILPEARTVLSGLIVESEYRPAREVGGDFFQILPNAIDGSLLLVAGDVTGKGLRAGMVVALLVGAVRTAAQYDPDPLQILNTLNQRLLGRSDAQATCLALRIDHDGSATLANAGHMAPYLNGEPVAMEGALPLGMIAAADFSLMHFNLHEGDRLILMSDGIAEATDANGNLFGFDRVQQLIRTTTTAAEVATAAQTFGQEDDISVISITRTPVLTPALA